MIYTMSIAKRGNGEFMIKRHAVSDDVYIVNRTARYWNQRIKKFIGGSGFGATGYKTQANASKKMQEIEKMRFLPTYYA